MLTGMEASTDRGRVHRSALAWVGAGVGALIAMGLAGGLRLQPGSRFWAAAGFVCFVLCARRAMALWRVDEMVFADRRARREDSQPREPQQPIRRASSPPRRRRPTPLHLARLLGFVMLAGGIARTARGQQTIFNVPTADVLDKGKLYLETDWLWRPSDPAFAAGSPIRGVYGLGGNVEAGVNIAGIATPGPSKPAAVPNVKWQPLKIDAFSITTGAFGQFFFRGAEDGKTSGMAYSHAAWKLPTGTRLTAGGFWASSGYASPGATGGGLFGLEQPIGEHVTLAADWYTGNSSLGYVSPGLIVTTGGFVLYAAYSIQNGHSKGNGLLLELGFNVP